MKTTTPLFDPDAMQQCRKRVDEFNAMMDETLRNLVEEIAMISGASNLTMLADFCNLIGLNADWTGNELDILPVGPCLCLQDK